MGPLFHPKIQTTFSTIEATRLTPAKEGKCYSVSSEGYGLGLWDAAGMFIVECL